MRLTVHIPSLNLTSLNFSVTGATLLDCFYFILIIKNKVIPKRNLIKYMKVLYVTVFEANLLTPRKHV